MEIFGKNLTTLERSMDLRMENQRLIVGNLANLDTPGYTAQRLDFQTSMANALRGSTDPAVIRDSTAPAVSLDGNNVDLDTEMGQLSQNKILYSLQSQLLGAKFRQLTNILDQDH